MKTIKIAVIALMGMSLGVKAQNFTSPISVSSSNDAIATFITTDDTWLYTQWKNSSGQRKAYMGFNPDLTNFVLGLENGANKITFPSGNIGIGTFNPKSKLHISGGSGDWNEIIQGQTIGSIHLDPENSTNNFGNSITFGASDAYSGENAQAGIYVRSDGTYGTKMYFSTTNSYAVGSKTAMSIDNNGKVGIGTNMTGNHRLAVEGSIGAREIKVEAAPNWSDFVFYEDYELPTLKEVEKHIKEKGHLKDIPSAKEVKKNGFFLGEMDAKLLQKIEELTLYTIEQEKKIKSLEKQQKEIEELKKEKTENRKQQKEIDELKALVQKLLKDKN